MTVVDAAQARRLPGWLARAVVMGVFAREARLEGSAKSDAGCLRKLVLANECLSREAQGTWAVLLDAAVCMLGSCRCALCCDERNVGQGSAMALVSVVRLSSGAMLLTSRLSVVGCRPGFIA